MTAIHPIDKEEKFKSEIANREIYYTHHFENERLPRRPNVSKEIIEQHLSKPKDLVEFNHSEDDHEREKYETLFDKSTKYYLKIVLSMEDASTYIVTAHVINKSKKEAAEELL